MKATSRADEEAMREQRGTMAPSDLCLIALPKSLFMHLTREAGKRNTTLAQLFADALDSYLAPGVKGPAPGSVGVVEEGGESNFSFHDHAEQAVAPKNGQRLRSFK